MLNPFLHSIILDKKLLLNQQVSLWQAIIFIIKKYSNYIHHQKKIKIFGAYFHSTSKTDLAFMLEIINEISYLKKYLS